MSDLFCKLYPIPGCVLMIFFASSEMRLHELWQFPMGCLRSRLRFLQALWEKGGNCSPRSVLREKTKGVQVVFCLVFHSHSTPDFGLVPNCVRADKNVICGIACSVGRELKGPELWVFSVIKTDWKGIRWTKDTLTDLQWWCLFQAFP